jgi:hypothetical protein
MPLAFDLDPAVLGEGASDDAPQASNAPLGPTALGLGGPILASPDHLAEEEVDGALPAGIGDRGEIQDFGHGRLQHTAGYVNMRKSRSSLD